MTIDGQAGRAPDPPSITGGMRSMFSRTWAGWTIESLDELDHWCDLDADETARGRATKKVRAALAQAADLGITWSASADR